MAEASLHDRTRRGWRRAVRALALAAALAGAGAPRAQDLSTQALTAGWRFRLAPDAPAARAQPQAAAWHAAQVPGSVQTDLLAAGLIGDPFWRDNEASLQWIGLADWEYRLDFRLDPALAAKRHLELVFDGLDTFADVELNGRPLLFADNMFRRWRVDAKPYLHAGDNRLRVVFHSPVARLQPWLAKQPYALPGEFDSAFGDEPPGRQTANYVRKAAYQYGWDWGPRYVTAGLWQPVRLEGWDALRLADFHIAQDRVDAERAQLHAQVEVQAERAGPARLAVRWTAPDGRRGEAAREVALTAGRNTLDLPLTIDRPQRWWPAGYGPQNLYRFHVVVTDADGRPLAEAERGTGLRRVELRRERDRWGRGFAFVVNGVPVFAKGANLIPFDSFPARMDEARMRQLLASARDANMNMLRVWGGGIYPSDAFFDEADRLGLMVWQDFMFGGAVPPYDEAFRANVEQEARQQVRRLRDHPSLVLWCGNNEVQTGWEAWPDRKAFAQAIGAAERARVEQGMRALFDRTLRAVAREESPEVPYWAGSPGTDYAGPANVPGDGDYHYWEVWSGEARPVEEYLRVTPRFQSEYGLQSLPAMDTIRAFAAPGDLSPESPVLRAHQKYDKGNGNRRLLLYVRRGYGEPRDFESFAYLSQVMQAEGIELAADHLRSARPRSMGSLYWQLNDVWPGASWSSIDYFGRWKALQFHARRFYAPLRLAAFHDGGRVRAWLVSDRREPLDGELAVRVLGFDGHELSARREAVRAAPLASTPALDLDDRALLRGADPARTVVVLEWRVGGETVSRRLVFFRPAVALALPDPGLTAEVRDDGHGPLLEIAATRLARAIWIDFNGLEVQVSDNAFDLLPGEHRQVRLTTTADIEALRRALRLRSLAGATRPAPGAAR
ncbi:beta-mannosidase [Fulvimonas soli]|uniref:Beta-mannosidase B n=1 Tax=Fulvimonas soli TaxID=155197 RepID=A0A316IHE9_9GAMM|nr:glycoside hydrolase family 2 protein [Fulvimonas soli]PWK89664.1 beta-mannosidase [Fulvimonas soli]TNY27683.1 beta-mannosidase [Fulvimonas soli]